MRERPCSDKLGAKKGAMMEKDFHDGVQTRAGHTRDLSRDASREQNREHAVQVRNQSKEHSQGIDLDQVIEVRREAHAEAAQRVKELNPDLFGEKRVGRMSSYDVPENFRDSAHIMADRQVGDLRSQINALQESVRTNNSQLQDFIKNANMKMERMALQIARLEQTHNAFALESGQKISQVNSKITERKSMDMKVQEMVDRHNNVIKSFEVRMGQLQKLLAEKDALLVSAQATLNDAKMEIARLKRL